VTYLTSFNYVDEIMVQIAGYLEAYIQDSARFMLTTLADSVLLKVDKVCKLISMKE
jgi:hypothetical protein